MGQTGKLVHYEAFTSSYVDNRNLDIWLPPSYQTATDQTYPVLYMHDGQNLFEDSLSGFGVEWGVDETLLRLSGEGKVPECIVVGIWNTPKRYPEYQPQKPYPFLDPEYRNKVTEYNGGEPVSDKYLKFIVSELKPFIDKNYRTKPGKKYTFIMGSSMGGLISLYAACEYPEVFAGAGCLSTHWVSRADLEDPDIGRVMADYLEENLPPPGQVKIYFDHGTEGLDAYYGSHQKKIDRIMAEKGYTRGTDWMTEVFEGADHNEISWQERLDIPMLFLLGNPAP